MGKNDGKLRRLRGFPLGRGVHAITCTMQYHGLLPPSYSATHNTAEARQSQRNCAQRPFQAAIPPAVNTPPSSHMDVAPAHSDDDMASPMASNHAPQPCGLTQTATQFQSQPEQSVAHMDIDQLSMPIAARHAFQARRLLNPATSLTEPLYAITTGGRVGPGRPGLGNTNCTNHFETRTNDTGANILDSIVDDVANMSGAPRDAVIQALYQASQNLLKLWQWHLLHGDGKSADPMERRLPTGLRFVTSAALAPLGYCLSCDGYDEALAAHPGSHLLSSIVLNLRTAPLTTYDSPCFPAFVSWWRPFLFLFFGFHIAASRPVQQIRISKPERGLVQRKICGGGADGEPGSCMQPRERLQKQTPRR